jgi:L-lactate utilization protein LutB
MQEAAVVVSEIRDNLRQAFSEAAVMQREKWKTIDQTVEKLETQIKEKKEEAAETLSELIDDLEDWGREMK